MKRLPTEKGLEMGIKIITKESKDQKKYSVLIYPEEIQKVIVEHFVKKGVN